MAEDTGIESKLVWNVFDGEATILDVATGNYFSLDSIGTEVWQGLQEKKSPQEIASFLAEKYGIDEATALNDVNELIAELHNAKIWS